ncbi:MULTISPECIES: hypothetical protein [unclassified Saccharicrinis]|uniref:hypothetical protein n=1 Tax=unclassified Saccharicrinis TaxID=2646859 RepID=UPI003D336184
MSFIKKLPIHGWIGFALIATFWSLNWFLSGLRAHLMFFPLWFGYCLAVDGLTVVRRGNSIFTRDRLLFWEMFLISIPVWWLFELLNIRAQNWFYDGRQFFTDLQYAILASLSFSTVIPAVFCTANLITTFKWHSKIKTGFRIIPTPKKMLSIFMLGWLMLALLLIFPRYFFPLMWLSVYFIIEPVNVWLKHKSLFDHLARGDWRPLIALSVGCLTCGLFWEMWNFYSYPKWLYKIPFVDFLHIFEMPLLGYLGYLSFPLELYAFYNLVTGFLKRKESWSL